MECLGWAQEQQVQVALALKGVRDTVARRQTTAANVLLALRGHLRDACDDVTHGTAVTHPLRRAWQDLGKAERAATRAAARMGAPGPEAEGRC
jgi:hypothetical protein